MKNTKRLLTALLVFVTLITCMLLMTSCNDDEHEHSYTSTVVPPNCAEQGYTKYTCDCGDTYNDNILPPTHTMTQHAAKAPTCSEVGHSAYIGCDGCGEKEGYVEIEKTQHNFVSEITEYPSASKAGKKTLECADCDHSEVETIAAFTASLPNVSETLASMIKEGKYSLSAKDGSTLILLTELNDYTEGTGTKTFIAFNVAKAELSSENSVVKGLLKLEFGTATKVVDGSVSASDIAAPETFDVAGAVDLYLNGDDISISVVFNGITEVNETVSVNEAFYSALAQILGIDYEELITAIYVGGKIQDIVPSAMSIISAIENIKLPAIKNDSLESYMLLFSTIGENMITVETDGDGNTVYTVDVAALTLFIEEIEDKTVVQFLNETYGVTTVAALMTFVSSIPNMTVSDIVNSISAVSSILGIDAEVAYDLIDMLIYAASGNTVSIQSVIKENYNKTIADLVAEQAVAENPYLKHEDAVATFKAAVNTALATVANLKIDDIYNMYVSANGGEVEAGFSITSEIKTVLAGLGEMITFDLVIDAEGNLVSLNADLAGTSLTVSSKTETVDESITEIYSLLIKSGSDTLLDTSIKFNDGIFEKLTLILNGYVETGNEVVTEQELVNLFDITAEYEIDATEGTEAMLLGINGLYYMVEFSDNDEEFGLMFVIADESEMILVVGLKKITEIVDEVTKESHVFVVADNVNTLFYLGAIFEDGKFTGASAEMNNYSTLTDMNTGESVKVLEDVFDAALTVTDDGNGTTTIGMIFNQYAVVIEAVDTLEKDTLDVIVTENDDVIASLSASVSTETVTEGETTTVTDTYTFDVIYDTDVLVDLDFTAVNGELKDGNVLLNFFYTALEDILDPDTGDVIGTNELTKLDTLLNAAITKNGNVIELADTVSGDTAKIELLDNGIKMTVGKTVIDATLDVTVENDVTTGFDLVIKVTDVEDVLLEYAVTMTDNVVYFKVFAQDYQTHQAIDSTTGQPIGEPVKKFTTLIDYTLGYTYTENGVEVSYYYADNNYVYYDLTCGFEFTEDGVTIKYDIERLLMGLLTIEYSENHDETKPDDGYINGPLVPTDATTDMEIKDIVIRYITMIYSLAGKGEITFTYEPIA